MNLDLDGDGATDAATDAVDPLAGFNFGKELKRTNKKLVMVLEKISPLICLKGFEFFSGLKKKYRELQVKSRQLPQ